MKLKQNADFKESCKTQPRDTEEKNCCIIRKIYRITEPQKYANATNLQNATTKNTSMLHTVQQRFTAPQQPIFALTSPNGSELAKIEERA